MNSIESREFVSYRTDQLSAAAFQAAEHEPPKEAERVDESDSWPVMRCAVCRERKPIAPMTHTCKDCFHRNTED